MFLKIEEWQRREKMLAISSVNCDSVWQLSGTPNMEEVHIWSRRHTSTDASDVADQNVVEAFFSGTAE